MSESNGHAAVASPTTSSTQTVWPRGMTPSAPERLVPEREAMGLVANILSRMELMRGQIDPKSRDVYDSCNLPPVGMLDGLSFEQLYRREGVAARVVQVYPLESWQVQPLVYEDEGGDTQSEFELAFDEMCKGLRGEQSYFQDDVGNPLWRSCLDADILSGIDPKGGLMFLGLDDLGAEEDPSKDPTEGRTPERLLFIRTFPGTRFEIAEFDTDQESPRFGLPLHYNVQFDEVVTGGVGQPIGKQWTRVHYNRVHHLIDVHHEPCTSPYQGTSRLEPVYNYLLGLRKLHCSSPEMYWKGAFPGMGFSAHPALGAAVATAKINYEKLSEMMSKYEDGLQRWFALSGMVPTQFSPQVVDPSPQINVQIEAICIKMGIPVRIFKGSERGELASSQDDKAWNDRLKGRQDTYITPNIIVPLIDRLINLGILPVPSGYSVWWPDLTSKSDDEIATTAGKRIDVLSKYAAGNLAQFLSPMDLYTHWLGFTDDEAEAFMDNAAEYVEEKMEEEAQLLEEQHQTDLARQQEAIERGVVPDPTGGVLGPVPDEDEEDEEEDEEEPTENAEESLLGTLLSLLSEPSPEEISRVWDYQADAPVGNAKLTGGRWVTIQGSPVYIKGGKIVAGPKALTGKKPDDLPDRDEEEKHKKKKPAASSPPPPPPPSPPPASKKEEPHKGETRKEDAKPHDHKEVKSGPAGWKDRAEQEKKLAKEAEERGDSMGQATHKRAAEGYEEAAKAHDRGDSAKAEKILKTAEAESRYGQRRLEKDRKRNELGEEAKQTHGDWGKSLSEDHKKALSSYADDQQYKEINGGLRTGKLDPKHQATVDAMDDAISKAPGFKDDTVLYRGVGPEVTRHLKEGVEFQDNGYTSTTKNIDVSTEFAMDAVIEMKVPKGTKAASMDGAGVQWGKGKKSENEYVLPRGTKYRVTGKREQPGIGTVYTVEVIS